MKVDRWPQCFRHELNTSRKRVWTQQPSYHKCNHGQGENWSPMGCTTIMSIETIFPPNVISIWGRTPKGSLMFMLNSSSWLEAGTRLGEPRPCQVVEDKMLIEAPSSITIWCMVEEIPSTTIWNGTYEGRRDSTRLFQWKEHNSELRRGTIAGIPTWPRRSKLTKDTWEAFLSLSKGRVVLDEDDSGSITSSTKGCWRQGSWEEVGSCCWSTTLSPNNLESSFIRGQR